MGPPGVFPEALFPDWPVCWLPVVRFEVAFVVLALLVPFPPKMFVFALGLVELVLALVPGFPVVAVVLVLPSMFVAGVDPVF